MQDFANLSDDDLLARVQPQAGKGASPAATVTTPAATTAATQAPDLVHLSDDDLLAKVQPKTAPATQPEPRGFVQELGHQVGLTARHALEGGAQALQVVTEPIRQNITDPAARALGLPTGGPISRVASHAADAMGLPKPETAQERIVGDASRLVAGAGLTMGAGTAAAKLPGMVGAAGEFLATQPVQQTLSAAGAGLAGGAARENGASEGVQAAAALVGGLGTSLVTDAAAKLGRGVLRSVMPQRAATVDAQLNDALNRSGVDLSSVSPALRQRLQADVEKALKTGNDLDPVALRRLTDFRRVQGAIPTRGTLTLDPVQLTREKNLAKSGANATDAGLQGLARVENSNNAALVRALNDAGAGTADDAFDAGQRAIGSLQRGMDAEKATINGLYQKARDSAGRSFPLDGHAFTQAANQALDDALLGHALPPSVATHMNRIAKGEVPFTVDYAEQLKTAMGNLRRSTNDGQTRLALDKVRQALDDAPVLGLGQQTAAAGARPVNPGNLPAVPNAPALGQEAIDAFNQARAANRTMMQRIEGNPALKAIYDGEVAPEDFVRKFVVGPSANVFNVKKLGDELAKDPAAQQAVRGSVVAWLKERAIGTGVADETARFNAMRYGQALATIGNRKLKSLGFSPEEIEQLKAVGRVGTYTTHQPVGSAVNNSNSGALLLGRGLDVLDTIASKVPLLNIGPQVSTITRGVQQSQAQNVAPALVRQAERAAKVPRLAPAVAYGGLLAAPPVDERHDRH